MPSICDYGTPVLQCTQVWHLQLTATLHSGVALATFQYASDVTHEMDWPTEPGYLDHHNL